ncbi:hypothetical protein EW146_g440 [Bondarzewia mesenterica]|uniref:MHD domain-containing protein n=1 Tax=Bondarzewia mesenterica TaxID=1095465 RepID=A0A4S4MDA6_9AGAM|nr:hypothetical protein EW146_g440 [Bondarzewia mesenterica]
MAIDGLIILDFSGKPIVQSGFRAFSPAYPLLHIDAFNNACEKANRTQDVDPVLYVPSFELDAPTETVSSISPISALLVWSSTEAEILQDYFGSISGATIKDNFDVVYQLLEETLDSGGHPLTTSPNALRDIVLPPSLLQKILSVAGVSGLSNSGVHGGHTLGAFASPIPWRKIGLRYNSNEIYFDILESLKAVMNNFANAKVISNPAFHPCVRLTRFAQSKVLSFVPPDGRFTLMEYHFYPSTQLSTPPAPATITAVAQNQSQIQPPFTLKALLQVTENGGTFDLTVTSRHSARPIEDFVLEIYLGEGATGASCSVGSGAEWGFVPSNQVRHCFLLFSDLIIHYLAMVNIQHSALVRSVGPPRNIHIDSCASSARTLNTDILLAFLTPLLRA